jgi:hypothetical protein
MTGVDELDGEIRRAVMELGDAAGLPRRFDQLDHTQHHDPLRSTGRVLLAAVSIAALLVAGVYGLAAVGDNTATNTAGTPVTSLAPPITDVTRPVPETSMPAPPMTPDRLSPLGQMVVPLLPDGFTLLYANGPRPTAVAYDERGIRLEITVDLDGADTIRNQVGSALTAVEQGEIASDGRLLLSANGDVIQANFSVAACLCVLDVLDDMRLLAPDIVTGLADKLDDSQRELIRGLSSRPINTADLRQQVTDLVETDVDDVNGSRLLESWDFNVSVRSLSDPGETSTAIEAVRAENGSIADGLVRVSDNIVSASQWVNGWQIVVSSVGADGDPLPLTDTEVQDLLAKAIPLFAAWSDVDNTEQGCATHVIATGDSFASIADRYDLTIDDLRTVNADLDALQNIGSRVEIPCPARFATVSDDQTGVDSFEHTNTFSGFTIFNTIRFATERSVYVVSGGQGNAGGAIFIERFDRSTRESEAMTEAPISDCAGPIEITDDAITDLAAIAVTCTTNGTTDTVDIFTAQTASFTDELEDPTE